MWVYTALANTKRYDERGNALTEFQDRYDTSYGSLFFIANYILEPAILFSKTSQLMRNYMIVNTSRFDIDKTVNSSDTLLTLRAEGHV